MRDTVKRTLAALLALLLGLSPAVSASEALGHDLHKGTTELSVGTSFTRQHFWSDTYWDLRTEHYITYVPNWDVRPVVAYGDSICSRATLTAMARALESQGQRVVGGTNGDFYVVATGTPIGVVMTGGVLRSVPGYNDSWYYAAGFRPDGTALLGQPRLTVAATFNGGLTVAVSGGVNKIRNAGDGYFLFTEDFGANTKNISPGVDVILEPVLENLGEMVEAELKISDPRTPATPTPTAEPTAAPTAGPTVEPTAEPSAEPSAEPTAEPTVEPAAGPTAEPTDEPGDGEIDESADLTDEELPPVEETPPPVVEELSATLVRSDCLRVNSRVACRVREVVETSSATAITPGTMVLSVNGKDDPALLELLRKLRPGDTVDLDVIAPDAAWAGVTETVGAMYHLVENGRVTEGLGGGQTARTAIGVREDGSVLLYTIDGKQPGYSVGASLLQVAKRLVELGCVEAVGLDGGGSTTLAAALPGGDVQLMSRPADGYQRANSVAVFLTTALAPDGVADRIYVSPGGSLLLAGAQVQLSSTVLDSAYYPVEGAAQPVYRVSEGEGTVTDDGLFTAGSEKGVARVTADLDGITGTASVTVIKTPDRITVSQEGAGGALSALVLAPGRQIDLKAAAIYRNLVLTAQDACFTWTVDGGVGTVDENGLFTAAATSGTGTLTVSAGGKSRQIPVTVAGHILTVDGFENGVDVFTATAGAAAYPERDGERVRFGTASARLEYDTGPIGVAVLETGLRIAEGERQLDLWVYGDGSGNVMAAMAADAAGMTVRLDLTALDFTGWRRLTVSLPEGTAAIPYLFWTCAGGAAAGTVWLDQVTTANEAVVDDTPPAVSLSAVEGRITAQIADNMDREIAESSLSLTYDGVPMDFTWDGAAGTLTAPLPESDGRLHRITVMAADASGNLARTSLDRPEAAGREPVFADMAGHWAEGQVVSLYDRGIVSGIRTEEGLTFAPDSPLSRGDFLLMTAKWLGLDLESYAGTELPFADADAIPGWDLNGVKAMYALGYFRGTAGEEGLLARAAEPIGRAEVMTILGRIQPKGYPEAELTSFSDADQVPAWAEPHIRALAAQGVVSGSGGQLRPLDPITRAEAAKLLYNMW